MTTSVLWTHTDPRGLQPAITGALARAEAGSWSNDSGSRADMRALMLAALGASANLSALPVGPAGEYGSSVFPQTKSERTDHQEAQQAILQGVALLQTGGRDPLAAPKRGGKIFTEGGEPATFKADDVALGWAGAVAIVGVVGVLACTTWQYFSQKNELEFIRVSTDANVKKHAEALGRVTSMVDGHRAKEEKAGSSLPWDEQEMLILNQLLATSKSLADWKPPAPVTIPNTAAAVDKVAGAVASTTNWLPLVGLAAAVWALS
ncbi:MAG: hypothetical protein KF718_16815 [Polyangiaceae bacterium]|nr:hypothetical protein [Polyangiaceae bacterium]